MPTFSRVFNELATHRERYAFSGPGLPKSGSNQATTEPSRAAAHKKQPHRRYSPGLVALARRRVRRLLRARPKITLSATNGINAACLSTEQTRNRRSNAEPYLMRYSAARRANERSEAGFANSADITPAAMRELSSASRMPLPV